MRVQGGTSTSYVAPQQIRGPAFCAFNSTELGLVFAFRGGLTLDDGTLEAAGHLTARHVPAVSRDGEEITAKVHGGFWVRRPMSPQYARS